MSRRQAAGVVCVSLVLSSGLCAAQDTATWLNPVDGDWSDPLNWSGGVVPNNADPLFFRAEITIAGAYQVDLDLDVELSGLELTAAGARLQFVGLNRSFSTSGTNLLDGADITGSGNSTFTADGDTLVTGGASLINVTAFRFQGQTEFTGADDFDLCDTCLFISGDGSWTGTGAFNLEGLFASSEIVVEENSRLELSGAGDRTVTGTDSDNQFINLGTLAINLDTATQVFNVTTATFSNEAGGRVEVTRGVLESDAIASVSGGRLTGGDWLVADEGGVVLTGTQITEIDVAVELRGTGSMFEALDTLELIDTAGSLILRDGRDFTTDPLAASFEVQGELDIGAGSLFSVSTTLANIDGTALRDGRFVVAGELEVNSGPIDTLGAEVVLDGAGIIKDAGTGDNLLAGLAVIEAGGSLELKGGAALTTPGNLTLDGTVKVGESSTLEVQGDLSAFQSGVFTGATLEVAGTLIADNARVERVEGTLMVGANGQILAPDGGGTIDALLFLERIESGGLFGLEGGRTLDLTTVNNTVELAGRLVLNGSGTEGPGNPGSALLADGLIVEAGGVLEIGILSISDFGHVATDLLVFGAGLAGETAGELVLTTAGSYVAAFGDEFVLIEISLLGAILGDGFAFLSVTNPLGAGLDFEQFIDARGLGVRVIPAPATGVAVLATLLAARRRRGPSVPC